MNAPMPLSPDALARIDRALAKYPANQRQSAVMAALDATGYFRRSGGGWGTAEIPGGGRERLAAIAALMDRIFAS